MDKMKNMKNMKKIVALVLLTLIASCKPNKEDIIQSEKFEYLAETGADESAPMEIVDARFICSDQSTVFIPAGQFLENSWGSSGSGIMAVGEDRKRVPEKMELTWFSYAEDKFYQGSFDLP
ncbi:DUF2931 family protein [Flavobacterium sp.]|uniref:DUF2931 family protein n=1 Tax=Flavobacterium sp. TaxID=239 RepID=UPI00286E9ABB|nr:DUF2931 family protein [Flavobacterium sp.]